MYATYFKRTLTALMASLILFSMCFVCHVSVLATEDSTENPAVIETDTDVVESSLPESSEDVVSQISDGGAPDFYDNQYYNDGSYEYHGSYAGLSSSVSQDTQQEEQTQKPVDNRSPLAKKYAKVLYIGMALFGGLSILLVGALVYFNLKVKQSKATYPDWYKRREAARRGKHAK